MNKFALGAFSAIVALAIAAALFDVYTQYNYCKEVGGTLVRGLIGVVCVK